MKQFGIYKILILNDLMGGGVWHNTRHQSEFYNCKTIPQTDRKKRLVCVFILITV